MIYLALILASVALGLSVFLFIIVGKLVDAMKMAGEAFEEIAGVLERNIIR